MTFSPRGKETSGEKKKTFSEELSSLELSQKNCKDREDTINERIRYYVRRT
jgi:hypothetical protein